MFNEHIREFVPGFIIVGTLLTSTFLLSLVRSKAEKGKRFLYTTRGGGRFGIMWVTYPFVKLSLYQDFLVISCWTRRTIYYDEIKFINTPGLSGINFETENFKSPTVFTFDRERILKVINDAIVSNDQQK